MIEVDGYRALERIGAGGLGDVYRATRVSTGGTVAIKVLRDVSDSSVAWHRTRRELTALVSLGGHSNVIGVLEVLDLRSGPALVMEYAPGGSVARLLDRRDAVLTVPEATLVGRHTAAALVAAHDQGIVHRDLKPQNLLIDAYGQVKLCDFGIASLARSDEFRQRTSALSMRYASPEDLDEAAELTPASDVYSLGATLLHLVHGAPPTLKERLAPWTPPPSDDDELAALDAVIAACLQPRPDARPTADDVLERLEVLDWTLARRCRALPVDDPTAGPSAIDPIESGTDRAWDTLDADTAAPTALRPDRPAVSLPARPEPADRRHRWPWVVGAVAMAALVGVAAAWWWPAGDDPDDAELAAPTPVTAPPTTTVATVTGPAEPLPTGPPVTVTRPDGLPDLDPDVSVWPFGDVGECLVQVNGVDELMPVDCGEPHDLQRFAVAELDGDVFVADVVSDTTDEECRSAFGEFVGVDPAESMFSIAVTRPSAASWAEGDRRYQCLLGVPDHHVVGDAAAGGI